jgi:hypothetical protein
LSVEALQAQVPGLIPGPAVVGVPYSFDFGNFISPYISQAPPGFFYSFTLTGGTLPPGLTLINSEITGTPTEAGNYAFTVGFAFGASVDGTSLSFGPFPFPASVDVTGNSGPAVAANPLALTFSFSQGSTTAATQSVAITNNGSSAQNFTASATVNSGGNWLSGIHQLRYRQRESQRLGGGNVFGNGIHCVGQSNIQRRRHSHRERRTRRARALPNRIPFPDGRRRWKSPGANSQHPE